MNGCVVRLARCEERTDCVVCKTSEESLKRKRRGKGACGGVSGKWKKKSKRGKMIEHRQVITETPHVEAETESCNLKVTHMTKETEVECETWE